MAKKKREGRQKGRTRKAYAAVAVALALVVAVLMVRYFRTAKGLEAAGNYYRGPSDAAIIIEEFSDFR